MQCTHNLFNKCDWETTISATMMMNQNIQIIENFFKHIKENDYYSIVNLFSKDAVVYEPFSKGNGISGEENLISFFKIMCRASGDLYQNLCYQSDLNNNNNSIQVISTYTKGGSLRARFTFHFRLSYIKESKDSLNNLLIKKLNIEFL